MSCCFGVRKKKASDARQPGLERKPTRMRRSSSRSLNKEEEGRLENSNKNSHHEANEDHRVEERYQKIKQSEIDTPGNRQPKYQLEQQKVKTSFLSPPEDEHNKKRTSQNEESGIKHFQIRSEMKRGSEGQFGGHNHTNAYPPKSDLKIKKTSKKEIEVRKSNSKQQFGNNSNIGNPPEDFEKKPSRKSKQMQSQIKGTNKKKPKIPLAHSYLIPEVDPLDQLEEEEEEYNSSTIKIPSDQEVDFEEVKIQIPKSSSKKESRSLIRVGDDQKEHINTTDLKENPQNMRLRFFQVGSIIETPMINTFRYDTILSHFMKQEKKGQSKMNSNVFSALSN